jgi:hypothetical protein
MISKIRSLLVNDDEISEKNQRLISIVFLGIAAVMSFQDYVHVRRLWDYHLSFRPTLISTGLAVVMMAPLYLRGILQWNRSIYTTISAMLILLVFASFIELAMGGNGRADITTTGIGAAIVLSWLGMKEVAGGCWMVPLAVGLYSAYYNSNAMGFYGYIYIACSFLGLVFHSKLNPGQLVSGIRGAYEV